MTPFRFPEANTNFGPPPGLDESQVRTIPAFVAGVKGGNLDGSTCVIVAWKPSAEEIAEIQKGAAIYVNMVGGLAPHFLTTSFKEAISI